MPKKKKLKVINAEVYRDEKTKTLLSNIQQDIEDMTIKGIVAIVIPSKGHPLLYMNVRPEEGFLQTYRATSIIANMISMEEEEENGSIDE